MPEVQKEKYTHIALEKAERLEGLIEEFFEITQYNLQNIFPGKRGSGSVLYAYADDGRILSGSGSAWK